MNGLLSQAEILRELKRYRYDRAGDSCGGHRVPIKVLAKHLGLHHDTLHRLIGGINKTMMPATQRRLSQAVQDIRAGRLRFVYRPADHNWHAEGAAVEGI